MFIALYSFTVKPGMEEQFQQAWEDAPPNETSARKQMREAILSAKTVFCMDLLEDLFVPQALS